MNPAPRPILDVAADLGLTGRLVAQHGPWRAKVALEALDDGPGGHGRYVLVTAVTPTGAGEGKTVTSIGLAMGLARRGHRSVAALRQSSLGPTFGLKGGGAGGGASSIVPLDECLLGLGGELFAVESANNLLAAVVDDALFRGEPDLDASTITWRRVVDVDDRALRFVVTGLHGHANGVPRETGFDITAASEVMAVLALSRDLGDLRARLSRIVVGFDRAGFPVTAGDLGADGAMAVLLRRAVEPNLMQTAEGTPVFIHAGPFANIAQGNSSIIADRIALPRADYVVTEAGFGSDLGAEKFFDLKCRASGLAPNAAVVVATVRALKSHVRKAPLDVEDVAAVEGGSANLRRHVEIVRAFGVPVVVAVNRFPTDTDAELDALRAAALDAGAVAVAEHDGYARGGEGCLALAEAVEHACTLPADVQPLYQVDDPLEEKVLTLARQVYGAADVVWEPAARKAVGRFEAAGYRDLPVCMAKTHLSLSHDPSVKGAPRGFTLPVREARLYAGAGFLTLLTGEILTMPGLPGKAKYHDITLDGRGEVVGLT
jgi:formate--tetrahydrofolate ligase